jgi:hypothetical protein
MKRKLRKIEMIGVSEIIPAGFNPPERTERKNLKVLRDKILQAGEVISPIITARDLHCIDGHRRLAVITELGWDAVPVIVTEYGLQEGWAMLNSSQRPPGGGDWAAAAALGMDPIHMPPVQRKRIEDLLAIAGRAGLTQLAEHKKSTWIVTQVQKLSRLIGDESMEYQSDILNWLLKHSMQYGLRRAMEMGEIEKITYAIAHDVPLEAASDYAELEEVRRILK